MLFNKIQGHDQLVIAALRASQSELVTMALKCIDIEHKDDDILAPLIKNGMNLLPNTSGARNAKEAIFAAQLAREALQTKWIKLEINRNPKHLLPDPIETLKAAKFFST